MSTQINSMQDQALFTAYTRLTAGAWARESFANPNAVPQDNISYEKFVNLLDRKTPFNKSYARPTDQSIVKNSQIASRMNNNSQFENAVMSIIDRAYQLGIVNYDNHLIYAADYKNTLQLVSTNISTFDVKA